MIDNGVEIETMRLRNIYTTLANHIRRARRGLRAGMSEQVNLADTKPKQTNELN